MKKSILALTASAFITGAVVISCNTPTQKVENAQENVEVANKDLDKANEEYLADVAAYRKETAERIAANNKSVAELNERIDKSMDDSKNNRLTNLTDLIAEIDKWD